MTAKDIFLQHKQIGNLITDNKLADAFILTGSILDEIQNQELQQNFNKQKETYNYLLEYSLKGVKDPEKINVYNGIRRQILKIADAAKSSYLLKFASSNKLTAQKRLLYEQTANYEISIVSEIKELIKNNLASEEEVRKSKLYKLFFLIWLTDYLSEEDYLFLKKYSASGKLYSHEMSIIVSALTISLLRHFDKRKFHALFDFYDANKPFVWNRALVGIVLAFYYYDKRISLYNDIVSRLKSVRNDENISKYTEQIIYQIVRSKETEKLSQRLQDEIIPEMQKFRPKIQDKLNLDDILSDGLIEDSNPDWEELFDDAPDLLDKMADFSKLQLEGSDVFMSAFAGFKNFPFYRQAANWFMPFYAENAEVKKIFSDFGEDFDADTFIRGLERSPFMCNSDKYSFCLNIGMMPAAQRNMIIELFKQESKQTEEIKNEDKLLNKDSDDNQIFTRYIQDLYRFFKLHPLKNEIEDIFETDLDIHNTKLYDILINDETVLEKISEMYFKKEFYSDAAKILETLSLKGNKEAKRYEKIGFCYQKIKNFKKASENYKKAEIIKEPSLWLTKKIAFCYRKLQKYEDALKYYLSAEKEDEKNLHIQANIGHCYLALEDYENALKKYFKVEYYDTDNKSVMRPLAWCSFLVGKFDTAESYFQKLIGEKPTAYDFINYGHLLFAKNEKMKAAEMYLSAIQLSNIKTVEDAIREDSEVLIKHEASKNDIDLLIDYVKTKML
ncbi:MAG: hypothetical protein J7K64_07525 [Bacteroidales bacterium]|nr:hypothetical protein [Bacteroidales bacterium]